MQYNKTVAITLAAVMAITVGTLAASAATNDSFWGMRGNRFNSEKHSAVIEAIESNDYDAWVKAVGEQYPATEVTAAEFPTLIQAHNLMQEGHENFEQARQLRGEIGLTQGFGMGRVGHRGMGQNFENREAVRSAIEAGDYDAWLEAVGPDSRIAKVVSEDLFGQLVAAHNAVQDGDYEAARAIRDELGIYGRFGKMGRGMNR